MNPGRWICRRRVGRSIPHSFRPPILLLLFGLIAGAAPVMSAGEGTLHRFTVEAASHVAYGVRYPLTFVFEVPPATLSLAAYRWAGAWERLPTRSAGEVYSGVEAARFDPVMGRAFVSAAFPPDSDQLEIAIVDELTGSPVSATYDSIARYYDASRAVVVLTADDWQAHDHAAFVAAANACRERELWLTAGIATRGMAREGWGPPDWPAIQAVIDQGFVEPASHSAHHLYPPYNVWQWGVQSSYEEEIVGSKSDILSQLAMPPLHCAGAREYLYTWIEPFGLSDHQALLLLGASGYLAERTSVYSRWFANWHPTYGLYPVAGTAWIDTMTVAAPMNGLFDWILEEGSIYYLMCHPRVIDWQTGAIPAHLDYLAHRPDVWYVGLGHLYVYHLMQDRGLVTHEALATTGGLPSLPAPGSVCTLWQPAPNPFRARTEIRFELTRPGAARLAIYDVAGRLVRRLLDQRVGNGVQAASWDGSDASGHRVPAGTYFIRLESSGVRAVERITCTR